MADTIRVNTDLLQKCAGGLKGAAQGFADAAAMLAELDTGKEWWSKMGRFSAIRLQDEGSSAELGDAGAAVRALTDILRRYDARALALGNSVSRAAELYGALEAELYGKVSGQDAGESANVIGPAEAAVAGAPQAPSSGSAQAGPQPRPAVGPRPGRPWPWHSPARGAAALLTLSLHLAQFMRTGNTVGFDVMRFLFGGCRPRARWWIPCCGGGMPPVGNAVPVCEPAPTVDPENYIPPASPVTPENTSRPAEPECESAPEIAPEDYTAPVEPCIPGPADYDPPVPECEPAPVIAPEDYAAPVEPCIPGPADYDPPVPECEPAPVVAPVPDRLVGRIAVRWAAP